MSDTGSFALAVLLAAAALLGALAANSIGSRIRVPAPAIFLIVAALASDVFPALGGASLGVDERVVTVCLIVILFDGGMHIGWSRFRPAAGAITWVGVAGTVVTAAAIALLARFLLGFEWQAALLLGAALSPTDPAVVFAVLGKREIAGRTGTLLEGESGVNDPVGIALLGALLVSGAAAGSAGAAALVFVEQMVIGGVVGIGGGLALGVLMRRVRLPNEALYPLRSLAVAALVYGVAAVLGGSGFLAVFVAGILVGDVEAPYRNEVRRFAAGFASLAEIVAFTLLGLTVSWRQVLQPGVLLPGLVLAALLVLVVRPLLVGPLLLPVRLAWGERGFVALAGLRGAVPILLGLTIRAAGVPGADRVAGVIFVVVLVSVIVQGGLTPQLAAWFRVPMRTAPQQPFVAGFRSESEPRDLRTFAVAEGSRAAGTAVGELALGNGWVSMVRRDGVALRLRRDVRLEPGDEVLVFADADAAALFRGGA